MTYELLEGHGTLDADGRFTAAAKGHARVRVTINGIAGDCGATVLA